MRSPIFNSQISRSKRKRRKKETYRGALTRRNALVEKPLKLLKTRGFSTMLQAKIAEYKIQFQEDIAGMSENRLLSLMGMINALLYNLARNAGAIVRIAGQTHRVIKSKLGKLLEAIAQGAASVVAPMSWLSAHLKTWWEGASHSHPILLQLRRWLEEIGCFVVNQVKTQFARWKSTAFEAIDLAKLLAIFSLCERELKHRGWEVEDIPAGHGYTTVLLFQALCGDGTYHRLEGDELEQTDVMMLDLIPPEEIYEELAARLNPDLTSLSIDEFLDVVFG